MNRLRLFLPMALDVVIPVVAYFALRALGANQFWALTLAGVGTGLSALVNTVRRRKLDGIGMLVLLEVALSAALLFTTNDPRVVAIKPAFYTALAGCYFLFTCVVGKPVVYLAAAPIATGGDPLRADAYRRAWDESPTFRSRERLMTAAFAAALLAESVLRVWIVYHWSPAKLDESFVISQLPAFLLLGAVLAFVRLQVPTITNIVDNIQQRISVQNSPIPA
ncbi:VC0807 family protein [Actinoplanes subtropicus]|uniref:VC0807 family protein n=1 Tax=Actinoplanes subtropicus TaxID=543632 RepID=UPI0004C33BBF|nr:VC0807 family protein [Actinoplanes subtropicus]